MKVVINKCFGGFGLSEEAYKWIEKYTGENIDNYRNIERDDEALIECIEDIGSLANGDCAELAIAFVPDEATDWWIDEYDGNETLCYVINGKKGSSDYVEAFNVKKILGQIEEDEDE